MLTITAIPALRDNYIWALQNEHYCAIIDPGEADPVLNYLQKTGLKLCAILNTHRHHDHINGIAALSAQFTIPVYGKAHPKNLHITHSLDEGDKLYLAELDITFDILHTPGHLDDHIVFYGAKMLFCGDMIFGAGCGRNFEGSIEQLYKSLQRLKSLPDDTLVYCAHEYTRANLNFSLACEKNNLDIQHRIKETDKLLEHNLATLPSTISLERATNPFMRCQEAELIQTLAAQRQLTNTHPANVFKTLRLWRNEF